MTARILVVDDESDVEMLFRQQFRRELRNGRFVLEFSLTAEAALTNLHAASGSLILLVSDINMPGMSGLDLLSQVRAMRPHLPVLMITAYGDARTRTIALERGANGLLTKPIDFAVLRDEINTRVADAP
jgi:CheY-like chemotaxis protein